MRRRDASELAGLSKADDSFSNPTVFTLHSAQINKTKNFTLAKFHPDCSWKMETNSLLLYSILDVILYLFIDVVITFIIKIFRVLCKLFSDFFIFCHVLSPPRS